MKRWFLAGLLCLVFVGVFCQVPWQPRSLPLSQKVFDECQLYFQSMAMDGIQFELEHLGTPLRTFLDSPEGDLASTHVASMSAFFIGKAIEELEKVDSDDLYALDDALEELAAFCAYMRNPPS